MTISELTEKNVNDALALYKHSTKDYLDLTPRGLLSDEEICKMLLKGETEDDITYLFYDKGALLSMVTISKSKAEIFNLHVNFDLIDNYFPTRLLEFIIKQYSAISRVFIWVCSVNLKLCGMLEDYGFEYTGEQQYLNKDSNILRFRYVFRRKK